MQTPIQVFIISLFSLSLVLSFDCNNINAPDGSTYNLGPIANIVLSGREKSVFEYYFNFSLCNKIYPCGERGRGDICRYNAHMCQYWGPDAIDNPDGQACIGQLSSVRGLDSGKGVQIMLTKGDFGRNGVINVFCDPDAGEYDGIEIESPPVVQVPYKVQFFSAYGCSTTTK